LKYAGGSTAQLEQVAIRLLAAQIATGGTSVSLAGNRREKSIAKFDDDRQVPTKLLSFSKKFMNG
jgi:hypothetical protein